MYVGDVESFVQKRQTGCAQTIEVQHRRLQGQPESTTEDLEDARDQEDRSEFMERVKMPKRTVLRRWNWVGVKKSQGQSV